MKPKIVGDARDGGDGKFFHTLPIEYGTEVRTVEISTDLSKLVPACTAFAETNSRAYRFDLSGIGRFQYWVFRGKVLSICIDEVLTEEECALEVMHTVLRRDRRYAALKRIVKSFDVLA